MQEVLDALVSRTSTGVLTAPAPTPEVLQRAFAAALRAPDHRMLRPWEFLRVEGEGLAALGELLAAAARADNPAIEEAEVARFRQMPLRAPLILVAVTHFKDDAKVPHWEQILSTGAAVQNLLLALHAQGFGTMWRTGPLAEHPVVKQGLGLAESDLIAGFIYVGTAGSEKKVNPLNPADFVRAWP